MTLSCFKFFWLEFVCFSMLFQTTFGQDLTVEFGEFSGMKEGAKFLLSDAEPNQKAIVAALMIEGRSIEELRTLLDSKNTTPSIKLLCAWHLAVCSAKSRLFLKEKATTFSQSESDLFLGAITKCGIETPDNWRYFLKHGEYLSNDWFNSFSESIQMLKSPYPVLNRNGDGVSFIETGHGHFVVPAIKEISEPNLLAFKAVDGGAIVVLEDTEGAWDYYCARIIDSKVVWLVRVEPYWVFPEGGNFAVDLAIGDNDDVVVFCALPCSLSINGFDLKEGGRTISFSSKLGDLSKHVIQR
jgi:hypothetical protein